MGLLWDRTEFDDGARKTFHVVPSGSTVYSDLVRKYGPDYVFKGNGATDGTVLASAIGKCTTGGNDVIKLYPGTYVAGAVVTIAKGVTIEGATGNAADTIWDCDTTDCDAFIISAAGVTLRGFSIDEPAAGVTDTITSTGVGTIIDNVIVQGGNITSTTATMNLTGNYTKVKNCDLRLIQKGVLLGGSYSTISGCVITGTDTTAGGFGISLTGAAARSGQLAKDNVVYVGATNPVAITVAANSDLAMVIGNDLMGGDTLVVEADTVGVANRPLSATISATVAWLAE